MWISYRWPWFSFFSSQQFRIINEFFSFFVCLFAWLVGWLVSILLRFSRDRFEQIRAKTFTLPNRYYKFHNRYVPNTFIKRTRTPLHYRWNHFFEREKRREDIKLDRWQLTKRRRRCRRRTFDYFLSFDLWLMIVFIVWAILSFSFFTCFSTALREVKNGFHH